MDGFPTISQFNNNYCMLAGKKYIKSKIYIALPVMDEPDYMSSVIKSVKKQTYKNYELFVCVNQPDDWWSQTEKINICENNLRSIEYLKSIREFPITIIDRCSKGNGWKGKKYGVGWARKTLMDAINKIADKNDIIISLDADTVFSENYFQSVINNFIQNPDAVALSVPYYHNLTNDETANRAILRYEIYIRYYSINLTKINNPYNFTALGSAIALPVWAYRGINGITPHKSGEDFYFLQKLRKFGEIILWNNEKVYPAARFSNRVFFGTGPAMIKGRSGDWSSYPVYYYSLFNDVGKTYDLFSSLFYNDIKTPMSDFLESQFNLNLWKPIRENCKTEDKFIKACRNKVDGLRILQYLKSKQKEINLTDEECLMEFLKKFYKNQIKDLNVNFDKFSFQNSKIEELNEIRDFLINKEKEYKTV